MRTVEVISLVFFLLLQCKTSDLINLKIHVLSRKVTQLENERECGNLSKIYNGNWALPNGRESAKSLEWYMSHNNLSAVWLGIRRSSMESWKWVDGSKDDRFKQAPGMHGCTVVALDHLVRPHECADETQGFICELPFNVTCPESEEESYCSSVNNKKYWFRCKAKNWFASRNDCQRQGGDLAVIHNNQIKSILKPIGADQPIRCTSFFIGLHREYWLRTTPTGTELVEKENWALNEPTSNDCAVFAIDSKSHRGAWCAEDCFSPKQGLCEQYDESYEESTKSNVRNDTSCVNVSKISDCDSQEVACRKEILIPLIVTIGALLFVSAAACFWWRKGKRKPPEGGQPPARNIEARIVEARNIDGEDMQEQGLLLEAHGNANNRVQQASREEGQGEGRTSDESIELQTYNVRQHPPVSIQAQNL